MFEAIVKSACYDYKRALRTLIKNPNNVIALREKRNCEWFFLNEMSLYCDLDGKTLIRKLNEVVENEQSRSNRKTNKRP